ncbi:aspartate racemase [Fructilactobacillus lindneri]|uniref:Aspartate racemase n=2 Tax=Fructilactobacillus lindneri TaxID=53444 RepID=A0A0R2JPQ5_9LACO|nr:amino acid racemase [Fructilactobacillus lindneri]ANZ58292.1 aspartate racemase [Fructilactobacillus lindneri]ANZ59614.1 aspartate racemase [Fructilactobacillus lindneri]KRN79119.1 aspartate racemase [Fructilactobacillus lindneri DSM 20690 = JCM 11027]POG98602.1 aspartate racemase [Fructilactobacillus lindneri]POH03990.1 aspartate racemase [Fructilactobacillus lindneri]
MKDFFTIIGGMGTEATESYIHQLNKKTDAHQDQDYLNYILVNHATVPDRTDYIIDPKNHPDPLKPLAEDIKQQSKLGPEFFALPCNTAHYFYNQLQSLTSIPILHMPNLAVAAISKKFPSAKRVGLIATKGTLKDKVYETPIKKAGYDLVMPTSEIADETMQLIYDDVKEQNWVDADLYHHILDQMTNDLNCDVVILGCTEISVAEERAGSDGYHVIDAQSELVDESIRLAEKMQKSK